MNPIPIAAAVAAGVLALAAPAHAHQSQPRASFSLQFGAPIAGGAVYYGAPYRPYGPGYGRPYYGRPYYGRPYYPPPVWYVPPPVYYYSPPTVITVPVQPPVYIEQGSAPAPAAAAAHWYYCEGARGYYPYVTECPGGWIPVPAQPAR
jgi:hypothetical protein